MKPGGKKRPPAGKKRRRKKKKKANPAVTAVLILLLVLLLSALGGAGYLTYRAGLVDTILPGTEAAGIPLGGLTYQEAAQELLRLGAEKYDGLSVTASLPLDNTLTISAWEAGLRYSARDAADAAWSYGRTGDRLADTLTWVKAEYLGKNSFDWDGDLQVSLDELAVRSIVEAAAVSIDEQLLRSGIDIADSEIRITKGASGLTLDEEAVTRRFIDALLSGQGGTFTYESEPDPDEKFDFQGLYDELYAEKAEAHIYFARDYDAEGNIIDPLEQPDYKPLYEGMKPEKRPEETRVIPELPEGVEFNGQPYVITRSVVGVSFDVAAAEAAWAAAGYGETVTIPLKVEEPEMSTEDYEDMLFADVLSKNWSQYRWKLRDTYLEECRTTYFGSTNNRVSNLKKACDILNGIVLMPGEVFSYNDALGERTAEAGWLPAPAYANGEVRQENGGGICQVSSTLYNAALYANLQILERECHQFQVTYLPWGMDATVSWGWPDLKFRNDKDYPIKIVAWVDEEAKDVCIRIVGTDTDHVYVLMRFNNWQYFDDTDTYHDAKGNPLAVGMQAGTWRELYHDGEDYTAVKPFSETYEAFSTYHYHTEDIERRNVPLKKDD